LLPSSWGQLARDPEDTVAVFCFELDLKILHRDVACPNGEKFKVRWFEEDVDDESWEDFCIAQLHGRQAEQHSYDVVIGSMCVPTGIRKRLPLVLRRQILYSRWRFVPTPHGHGPSLAIDTCLSRRESFLRRLSRSGYHFLDILIR
jgi:hypothetical protein